MSFSLGLCWGWKCQITNSKRHGYFKFYIEKYEASLPERQQKSPLRKRVFSEPFLLGTDFAWNLQLKNQRTAANTQVVSHPHPWARFMRMFPSRHWRGRTIWFELQLFFVIFSVITEGSEDCQTAYWSYTHFSSTSIAVSVLSSWLIIPLHFAAKG